jgi:glutamate---cysteine ligase / carboxylate-amine ligase
MSAQSETVIGDVIPEVNFGSAADFSLGVEEELLLVDSRSYGLDHGALELLERLTVPEDEGEAAPEAYAALVELASPIRADASEAVASCGALRGRLRSAGATVIGAGLHPAGEFGDTAQFPSKRYRLLAREMRGLLGRTPTCALHVHVGLPDAETAIRVYNALRGHLPLLQALSANSPYWHGRDSGLASARAQVFRAFPRSEIPPAFSSFDEYAELVGAVTAAGELPDYTFLWWDIRPHPILGTVEVRALDSQSSLRAVAGIVALVHSLASWAVDQQGPWESREVLMESSFRAARDGLDATIWGDGAMRPVAEVARETVQLVRPHARELGSLDALEEIDRLLAEGGGAARQRAAFHRGGMSAVLAGLAEETARF